MNNIDDSNHSKVQEPNPGAELLSVDSSVITKTPRVKISISIFFFFGLVIVVCLYLVSDYNRSSYHHLPSQPSYTPELPQPTLVDSFDLSQVQGSEEDMTFEPIVYSSNYKNLSFNYPNNWVVMDSKNINLPPGAEQPWFVIKHSNTGCVIAGTKLNYRLVANDDNDKALYSQVDYDGWYVPISESELGINKFSYTRSPLNKEVRRVYPFLLWQDDGLPVPEKCNEIFNFILDTLDDYVETIILNDASIGTITMERFDREKPGRDYFGDNFMAFNTADGQTLKVMDLPKVTFYHGSFIVKNNLIYGIQNLHKQVEPVDRIIAIDPLQATSSVVLESGQNSDRYIVSLFIIGSDLYFLAGDKDAYMSLDSYRRREFSLYKYSLDSNEVIRVVDKIKASKILGHNEETDELYITNNYGDAGCVSYETFAVNLDDYSYRLAFNEGWCFGDEGADGANKKYNDFQKKVNLVLSDRIILDHGKLIPPAEKSTQYSTEFYFAQ